MALSLKGGFKKTLHFASSLRAPYSAGTADTPGRYRRRPGQVPRVVGRGIAYLGSTQPRPPWTRKVQA